MVCPERVSPRGVRLVDGVDAGYPDQWVRVSASAFAANIEGAQAEMNVIDLDA
ncbi:MAG: hypothetical protein ACJAZ4_001528 [Neptuniibacter pectenicola]